MAGVVKSRIGDDDVYEATAIVNGGDLVIPAGGTGVGAVNVGKVAITQAGATALNCLGVAARRAEPVANQALSGTDGDGFPVAYPNPVSELTTVYKHCVTTVVYTAVAVPFGTALKTAAAGQVQAWVSGTDSAAAIVGYCRVVGGMSAAGGAGLALIL